MNSEHGRRTFCFELSGQLMARSQSCSQEKIEAGARECAAFFLPLHQELEAKAREAAAPGARDRLVR